MGRGLRWSRACNEEKRGEAGCFGIFVSYTFWRHSVCVCTWEEGRGGDTAFSAPMERVSASRQVKGSSIDEYIFVFSHCWR